MTRGKNILICLFLIAALLLSTVAIAAHGMTIRGIVSRDAAGDTVVTTDKGENYTMKGAAILGMEPGFLVEVSGAMATQDGKQIFVPETCQNIGGAGESK